ncbi:Ferritin, Dps family protein [Halanaerobium saccharolyticum subsp. saccharolyticum DSM 6643]|uniref:Ferritin n=1 Tax=Halanaerobium saccharolyticum subsp. saccharolyticum DSM 6643 TaxID=1293054 RepID=M5E105_9FIRM|nr:ferritin [Halanaerobium saccharolyticum]CCU79470.1 Ferritin, Dps family protein [Halanaerobium saccharolyticum subsp. saccharolyticum DSM 6643]
MIKEKVEKALNEQVNAELYSAYLYQSMAAYFEDKSLSGFARWMDLQAKEEMAHARKIYDYVNERGGRIILAGIDKPKSEWESNLDVFEDSLAHEEKITAMINDLVSLAAEEKDYATHSFLQWFVDEQVEEEDTVGEIVDKLKLVGDSAQGLFMMDDKLAARQEAAAAAESGE